MTRVMETTPLFTPVLKGERQHWTNVTWIEGYLRRGPGRYGVIQLTDGRKFIVYGKKCGLDCHCDARVVPYKKK